MRCRVEENSCNSSHAGHLLSQPYRRNLFGSTKKRNPEPDELNLSLDRTNLLEVYAAFQEKCPKHFETHKNWKCEINDALNQKLGVLNRNFRQLKLSVTDMERHDRDFGRGSKPSWMKDDLTFITDLNSYKENPRLFLDFGLEVGRVGNCD